MARFAALALIASIGCSSPELSVILAPDLEPALPVDGFTTFTPQGEVIFVSTSEGDDANDGRSAETPFRTIARGIMDLRDGSGDWMLLRRGDLFSESLGTWTRSGSSASSPMLVGAYGSGPARPRLDTGTASALFVPEGTDVQHLALVGLTFVAGARDPGNDTTSSEGEPALRWFGTGGGLTVEDCSFYYYSTAIHLHPPEGEIRSVVVRRSAIVRSWAPATIFPQGNGIYAVSVSGLTIEHMLFDHVGWDERASGGERNLAGHAINVKETCSGVVVRDNVIVDSSSHAVLAVPSDLVAVDNVFSGNAYAFTAGGRMELGDNVILDGSDIGSDPRAAGITFISTSPVSGTVSDNLLARAHTTQQRTISIEQRAELEYRDNLVFDWADDPLNTTGPFVDPTRSLASYDASIGGPGTIEHLVDVLAAQSRTTFDATLSAASIRAHVREGFTAP